jgi:excisionase family DNA binding protein
MSPFDAALQELVRRAVRDALHEELPALLAARPAAAVLPGGPNLTVGQAATLACVKPDTIRRWLKKKVLGQYGTKRKLLVRRAELERLLEAGTPEAAVENDGPSDEELSRRADVAVERRLRAL